MHQENLITKLGRAIDEYWAERKQTTSEVYIDSSSWQQYRRWLPSRGNVLFTTFMIGLLIWAQSTGAIGLFASNGTNASSIGTIAYQGRLASAGGAPLTQTIGMGFRLYNAATGSVPLWTEQWTGANSVQVSDGLFNVMLGSLTPIPQSVIAGNSNLFLGITVGTDGEMSPRIQLGSVPFSVQALTVPDGSITTAKITDGAITQTKLANDVMLGLDGWERDESSTTNPTIEQQTGLLLQHGYAQHVLSNTDITNTFYDHYVPFPVSFQEGTVPSISILLTGESASAADVPKGGVTNGTGQTAGRLFAANNIGFTLRSTSGYAGRRQGFHWIAVGQK